MRKRFEQQQELDTTPIAAVKINMKTRHQSAPLLAALQYIFITPELSEKIFSLLDEKIIGEKQQTGRPGMSLWEILVLGVIRLNLNLDYDSLHDQANNHLELRGILGVNSRNIFYDGKFYNLQTIKDNVRLLDEETLQKISAEVVKHGHELKKKESGEGKLPLELKTDGYAVETTIHFPTDLNLLWDSARKSLDMMAVLVDYSQILGWRKIKYLRRKIKKQFTLSAQIHQRRGKNYKERLQNQVKDYLSICNELDEKIKTSLPELLILSVEDVIVKELLADLDYYHKMLVKHNDLVERRLIKGGKIPHEEKVFSIFEPHTEWVYKGKLHRPVELGHNVIITTDQFQFILDHKVLENEGEKAQVIPLGKRLEENWEKDNDLNTISFDKGFGTKLSKEYLQKTFNKVVKVVMPKRGRKTSEEREEEKGSLFRKLKNKHSALESNVNELEHSGVNKVPDKKIEGFKRYVALGVLAYNLKRLGRIVLEQKLLSTVIELGGNRKKQFAA